MSNNPRGFADDVRQDIADGRIDQWAELYALDAVSESERETIDQSISTASEDVRQSFEDKVRQARETITAVYATPEADPPPALRTRIFDQLPDASTPIGPARADAGGDELAGRRRHKAKRSTTARRWIIGVAAAAVVAIGGVTVVQNLEDPSLQEQVVEASDVNSTTIEMPNGGVAEIKRSDQLNTAVVTLRGVPAPQAGKVYQMWRLPEDGTAPESVGIMTGEEVEETKTTVVQGIEPYSALAITVEPPGGSKTPTMPIVAQIPLEA